MALRVKTVEYAWDTSVASLADGVRLDFASKTLTIAETSSRTFRSVTLEVTARDDSATAASLTAWTLGITLAAVARDDATVTDTITNSGEHQTWVFTRDCTSYFQTNFGAATTQTCVASVTLAGMATINLTAKLIITYEYNDTSATTRTKTVRIPIDSPTTVLTNSLATVGGANAIPKLTSSGLLPEASVSIKDLWFEIEGNEASTSTSAFQLGMDIDSGAENLDGSHRQDLNSAVLYKYIWSQPSLDPTAAHTLRLRTTVTARMSCPSVVMHVTYTYDHSASTSVLNHIALPFGMDNPGPMNSSSPALWRHKFNVCEPGTITLKQSGFKVNYTLNAGVTGQFRAGSQATYNYTMVSGTTPCAGNSTSHRLDSGALAGTGGLTLAAGNNTLSIRVDSNTVSAVSGVVYLNYTSDIADNGDGEHAHTTHWLQRATNADQTQLIMTGGAAPATTPNLPETYYRIQHVGCRAANMCNSSVPTLTVTWGDVTTPWGQRQLLSVTPVRQGELGLEYHWADMSRLVKKCSTDPTFDVVDIETVREWQLYGATSSWKSLGMWVTHRGFARTVSGNLRGYTGDGSGVTVDVFNADNELVASVTSSAGGAWTANVYDERTHFAVARQGADLVGRSDNLTPA